MFYMSQNISLKMFVAALNSLFKNSFSACIPKFWGTDNCHT